MKIAVVGAGGIVGQHMVAQQPKDIEAIYTRASTTSNLEDHTLLDLYEPASSLVTLDRFKPDVIVNLAGENRVDVVEKSPKDYVFLNTHGPDLLAYWCMTNKAHMLQVSTQGVFDGEGAPYAPGDFLGPKTQYGLQKRDAEYRVMQYPNWTIARLTFVLGVRLKNFGRTNPLEDMFSQPEQLQVNDRWFSPVMAEDAAAQLWKLAVKPAENKIYHIGEPIRVSRYDIALKALNNVPNMGVTLYPVGHRHFPGLAPRPKDTTWANTSLYSVSLDDGIRHSFKVWCDRGF